MSTEPRLALVVEDSDFDTMIIRQGLDRPGTEIKVAGSIAEARNVLASGVVPAIIIVDRNLPDGNGHDLAVELRGRFPDADVICTSGSAGPTGDPDVVNKRELIEMLASIKAATVAAEAAAAAVVAQPVPVATVAAPVPDDGTTFPKWARNAIAVVIATVAAIGWLQVQIDRAAGKADDAKDAMVKAMGEFKEAVITSSAKSQQAMTHEISGVRNELVAIKIEMARREGSRQ